MKYLCHCCNDIIESKHRWHFVQCKCGKCFADGGNDYTRLGFAEGIEPPTRIDKVKDKIKLEVIK